MFKSRITLDTMSDIQRFVAAVSAVNKDVFLTDGSNFKVSAKSLLGAICTVEWNKIFVECEDNIGHIIDNFRIFESD